MTEKELKFLLEKGNLACANCGRVLSKDKCKEVFDAAKYGSPSPYEDYLSYYCGQECIELHSIHAYEGKQ